MANAAYNRGMFRLGSYNWDTDAINLGALLVKNTYVFVPTHNVITDINPAANEAVGLGYVRLPVAAAARTMNQDDAGGAANFRIADSTLVWTALNAGIDLRIVVFFIDGVDIDDNTNNLLGYIDTGTNIPINSGGGDVTVNFSLDGCLKLMRA